MSRIGRKPITIPEGVTVKIEGSKIVVSGPKGTLEEKFPPELKISLEGGQVVVSPKTNTRQARALFGTVRTLIANMIQGVTGGFRKTLKLMGIGFRAKMEGTNLVLSLGFSHPVVVEPALGIKFEVEGADTIKISGINKAAVGQVAAKIRMLRPPDVYKGKGMRYQSEEVRRKPGKAGKVGAAGFGPQRE
jgi:large subunit ribosomal protein L6